ncbi:hypothetical protein [Cupriavidus sp. TMH.W2]|uniref:hypothetical protein n=1 Tax=Cupriavidus sp. TMH.W2 TaxID=3434465 RepID=UPI003D787412
MSEWRYRDAAIGHGWEFLDLALEREPAIARLHALASAQPKLLETYFAEHQVLIVELVAATPSKRPGKLRSMAGDDEMVQIALILGAWQHCRKAVLAYDWLMDNPGRFQSGESYRHATVRQGLLFDQIRARKWTRWPMQWGPSPFPGEKSRRDRCDAPDFDEMMDEFDPKTGLY